MHGYVALIMMLTIASSSVFARGFFIGGGAAVAAAFSQHGEFPVGVQGSLQYGASFGLSLGDNFAVFIGGDYYETAASAPVDDIIYRARKGVSMTVGVSVPLAVLSTNVPTAFGVSAFAIGQFDNFRSTTLYQCSLGGGVAPYIDLYLPALRFISLRASLPVHLIIFGERSTAVLCGVRCDILFYPFAFGNAARNDVDVR
ncbi:MAG: hypothetical protein AABZ39_16160 [Spirochaetota bacterium]